MLPAPTVTGYQGFWQQHAPSGQGGPYALYGNRYALENKISQLLGQRGYKQSRRLFLTLLGTGTGATATETDRRVSAPNALTSSQLLGGNRDIETVSVVNRATTAADLTYVQGVFNRYYNSNPTIPYTADLSGNGGGGKAGQ